MTRSESPLIRLLRFPGKVQFTTALLLGGVVIMTAFPIVALSLATVVRAQPTASASALPLEETRGWAILAGGRAKPVQTFAKETALALTGSESVDGVGPLEILWGYVFAAEDFGGRPYLRIESLELRAKLGLRVTQRRFAFDALAGNPALRELVERATERQRDDFELDRLEGDALAVYRRLERAAGLISSEALTLVPNAAGDGTWSSPASLAQSRDASRRAIHAGFGKLAQAYRAGDAVAFRREARALTGALRNVGGAGYPSTTAIDRELFYADFNAFGKAWKLYLVGALVILILGFGERTLGYRAGLLLIGSGFVCHSIGIGIRWAIAGRAPVSDMYESLIFMGWGAIALGLTLEIWQRRRIVAASAALLGFLCLAFAENLPIDSNINPLASVLAHTSWLAVHVMTIMLAYSAFGLAMLIGHAVLFVEVFRKDRSPLLGWLSKVLYKTLQIGALFLAAGIIFGALWANESWGRYWGWDPKETWSLITFFVYLAIIHARFAGWLRGFGLAVGAVLGFLSVIMTYYGVNFILTSGMHAYGVAEGGQFFLVVYALAECAIVVAAQIMRTTGPGQKSPARSETLGHGRVPT
ncbi:MAG: cytochrome c biogenesis protein CcsA [Deltaproteobacteria bacterium]|nr:cytochrome c biogenesis protein CcsA [Deltaproteobacteria bacterium]